jgi:hypothetical protein
MRPDLLLAALLVAAPAAYAWWTGRTILRSLEDPALDELLHARQRRPAQVTLGAIVASGVVGSAIATAIVTLLVLLVVQYPIRRAVYGDRWSLTQYVRFSSFSFLAGAGLWVFAVIAPSLVVEVVRGWIPLSSPEQLSFALVLGAASSSSSCSGTGDSPRSGSRCIRGRRSPPMPPTSRCFCGSTRSSTAPRTD